MSLTFDYVTMPPKSQEVSHIQNAELTRFEHGQQEVATQFGKEIKNQSEQTVRRQKPENHPDLRDEGQKHKKRGQKGKSGRESKQNAKQEEEKHSMTKNHLDIRI